MLLEILRVSIGESISPIDNRDLHVYFVHILLAGRPSAPSAGFALFELDYSVISECTCSPNRSRWRMERILAGHPCTDEARCVAMRTAAFHTITTAIPTAGMCAHLQIYLRLIILVSHLNVSSRYLWKHCSAGTSGWWW
jgi:hypothetical protein